VFFQLPQLPRHRRVGGTQALGSGGETARINDGAQRTQGSEVIHRRAAPGRSPRHAGPASLSSAVAGLAHRQRQDRVSRHDIAEGVLDLGQCGFVQHAMADAPPPARSRSRLALASDATITR
jgi:hypothetical protein